MTEERDDSGELSRSVRDDRGNAPAGGPAEDEELFAWATGETTGWLLAAGIPEEAAEEIQFAAYLDYGRFKKSLESPRTFILRRIALGATQYLRTRDAEPEPRGQGQPPHPLDVIRARATLDLLTAPARRALEMVFFEGRTYEDVAIELDVSLEYVRRLVRKAMRQVEAWIQSRWPREQP